MRRRGGREGEREGGEGGREGGERGREKERGGGRKVVHDPNLVPRFLSPNRSERTKSGREPSRSRTNSGMSHRERMGHTYSDDQPPKADVSRDCSEGIGEEILTDHAPGRA